MTRQRTETKYREIHRVKVFFRANGAVGNQGYQLGCE